MDSMQSVLIVMGSVSAFIVIWLFVVFLTSWMSGWGKLADVYPARMPFNEECWSWQSGSFRWSASYSGILKVCADTQALHLSVLFMFRPGHTPLSIPWEDISGRKRFLNIELRFRRADHIPVRISPRLAGRLEQASGGLFQYHKGS